MTGCNWDPTFLYFADRESVMFKDASAGTFWQTHDVSQYRALFSCDTNLNPAAYLPPGTVAIPDPGQGALVLAPIG